MVELHGIDFVFIFGFFVIALIIGVVVSKQAGKSEADFFLGGRTMPWWLLGFSMVATTFSTDTPNFVTDIVRKHGVASNWMWWAFLITGMLTVFVYASLWRRSGITTDVEFYEIRYSGKEAAFLRGFRAIYLGLFFNVMIMATVTLAAIKIGGVMLGLSPMESVIYGSLITVIFSTLGGFKGVLLTDFLLFIMAMVGAVAAAYFSLTHESVGGLDNLITTLSESKEHASKLDIFPSSTSPIFISFFIIPLAVQWWSVWYPGAEPGGGGYLAQRMLAAKNEKHAVGATMFFQFAHYALRPWPWIIVALASLLVFPDLDSIRTAFPHIPEDKVADDLAYPAMITFLPAGWVGLVMTSLIAAYMSTISTHLNWGASYLVSDFYQRFMKPDASEKELVTAGRVMTVILMVLAGFIALFLESSMKNFNLLLQIGAGTGLIFILRWFWWRINATSEVVAMVVSFVIAVVFYVAGQGNGGDVKEYPFFDFVATFGWEGFEQSHYELIFGVSLTTICWVLATLITKPASNDVLRKFIALTNPGGSGWDKVKADAKAEGVTIEYTHEADSLPRGIICMVLGCFAVYGYLFFVGYSLYGQTSTAVIFLVIAVLSTITIFKLWFANQKA